MEWLFDLIKILFGFVMGIIFITYFKSYLFFKFLKSPIEISSDLFDQFNHIDNRINVEKIFHDTLTLINISDLTIKINKLDVFIKILDKYKDKRKFMCSFYKDSKKFRSPENENIKSLEYEVSHVKQYIDPYSFGKLRKIGQICTEGTLFPIILNPHESIKVYFAIIGINYSKKKVNTKIIISPNYKFKKTELHYGIIFRQK